MTSLLVALFWIFGRQMQIVQAQSERMTVRFTLKTLRDALVLDKFLKRVPSETGATNNLIRNPFLLLADLPANFAGEVSYSKAHTVVPGNWVFDPECRCVGYRLLHPERLEPEQFADVIWFRLSQAPVEVRLVAQAPYIWLGELLD